MDFDTFSVDLIQDGGSARLALTGELDLAAVPTLEAAIPNLAAGEVLVVDLRDLTFIDSSGIHVLMRLDTAARDDGWSLVLVRPTGSPTRPGPLPPRRPRPDRRCPGRLPRTHPHTFGLLTE